MDPARVLDEADPFTAALRVAATLYVVKGDGEGQGEDVAHGVEEPGFEDLPE